MTRALSPTDATQVTSAIVGVVEFLDIALPTGHLYLTSGHQSYTFGGHTYAPANGQWGTVANYNETADSVPRPMSITLSGVDSTLIGNLVGNNIQWIPITYYLGCTDATGALLDTPSFQVTVYLGDCTITLNENAGTVSISGENPLADLQNRNSNLLLSAADQKQRFAGDTIFDNLASLINKVIYWGQIAWGPSVPAIGGGSYLLHPPTKPQ